MVKTMEKEILIIGNAGPSVLEKLHEKMESGQLSGEGIVIIPNEIPEPVVLPYFIHKDCEKPNIEQLKPNRDWKKHGRPKKWKMK